MSHSLLYLSPYRADTEGVTCVKVPMAGFPMAIYFKLRLFLGETWIAPPSSSSRASPIPSL